MPVAHAHHRAKALSYPGMTDGCHGFSAGLGIEIVRAAESNFCVICAIEQYGYNEQAPAGRGRNVANPTKDVDLMLPKADENFGKRGGLHLHIDAAGLGELVRALRSSGDGGGVVVDGMIEDVSDNGGKDPQIE